MALKDWRTVKREVVLGVAVRGNDIVSEVDGGVGGVDDLLDAVAGVIVKIARVVDSIVGGEEFVFVRPSVVVRVVACDVSVIV